jgi:hypothetical protein
MALTVVGKLVGLTLVVGAVVGAIYAYKALVPAKVADPVDIEQPVQQAPVAETPTQAPVYTQQAPAPVEQPAPIQPAPQEDASSNRGMQFLLNQGKK